EGRAPDQPHLARSDEVGERAQRLVDVGLELGPMDLVEVDPVGAEAAQAVVDLVRDPAARVPVLVRVVAHLPLHLGGEHGAVPAPARERLTDDVLRLPARVHVCGVDEVDPRVQGAVDDAYALVVIGLAPGAEHHRAEAQRADSYTGAAEVAKFHSARLLTAA